MIAPYVQAAAEAPLTRGSSLDHAEVEAVMACDRAAFRFSIELFGDGAQSPNQPELAL